MQKSFKNVLISGNCGFIASNLVRYILKHFPDAFVVGYDALLYMASAKNLDDLEDHPRFVFIHGNICYTEQVKSVLKTYEIDTIIHAAAESHNDRSMLHPESFVENNIVGTHSMLRAAKEYWLSVLDNKNKSNIFRFIHISTDEVFGDLDKNDPAWQEDTCHWPNTPYSATKSASDFLVRSYVKTYNFPAIVLNCGNNYGPRQFTEKFIPKMIELAFRKQSFTLHGNGGHLRDWIYVDDFCDAIISVIEQGRLGETYNVSGANPVSNLEILTELCDILDEKFPREKLYENFIEFVDDRPNNDQRYALDIGKITGETSWYPKTHLREGLEKTVDWYLDNQDWLDAVEKYINSRDWKHWEDFKKFDE